MGRAKGGKGKRRQVAAEPVAERHGFDTGGLLGHDSTYSVNVTEHLALQVDTVLACVSILADLTADAVFGEFRGTERLPDSRLVQRPMASITRRTWTWMLVSIMALYNGAYLWRRFGRDSSGTINSLEPVAPSRVTSVGPKVYIDAEEVDPGDLRWVPRMTFPTLTRELASIIRLARSAIAASWSADSYRADYWEKGGKPPWYVQSDQPLTNDDATVIKERIVARRTTSPGEPLVFGKGAKIADMGADLTSQGTSESLERSNAAIARYFRVPVWLINVQSHAGNLTYQNASAAGLDLVRYTLQPGYAGPIGDALSDELPGSYLTGRRVVLDLTHLTRGTILEQAQAYAIATGNRPWLLPSEVRADLHLPMDMSLDDAGEPAPELETIPAARGMRAPLIAALSTAGR
jgi:HK97 family phage portal protein